MRERCTPSSSGAAGVRGSQAHAVHELKCWPEFFADVASGAKPFEVRRNDRGFQVGDVLILKEWDQVDGYTGCKARKVVTYLLNGGQFGVAPGYVVMGLAKSAALGEG